MDYHKISLQDVEKFELGPEPSSGQTLFFKNLSAPRFHVLRIHYRIPASSSTEAGPGLNSNNSETSGSGYFHTFRSCNLRFFNNLVITTKSADEMTEALRGICHTIQSTALYFNFDIQFDEVAKMAKKKSKAPNNLIKLSKLRTRMSIVSSQPPLGAKQRTKSPPSDTFKLNKIGKLIGNKLLDLTKKSSVFKPIAIDVDRLATELSKEEFKPGAFYLDDGAKLDAENSGAAVLKDSEPAQSVGQGLALLVGSLMPASQASLIKTSSSAYLPKLSQRDFANRQERLAQMNELTKDAKVKFIFI